MNKKKSIYAWISSLFLINILPFISAYGGVLYDIRRGPEDVIRIVQEFTSPFFEALLNTSAYSEFFFAKVLLLILVFVVVYYVLKQSDIMGLKDQKGVLLIITSVISILAMRYMPENDLIKGILLPYTTFGIAISTFLPFLIFFFFVEKSGLQHLGRRMAWALYGIIFAVLWYQRSDQIPSSSNWIYTLLFVLIAIAFLFDSGIHQYFGISEMRAADRQRLMLRQADLVEQEKKIRLIGTPEANKIADKIHLESEKLAKKIARL